MACCLDDSIFNYHAPSLQQMKPEDLKKLNDRLAAKLEATKIKKKKEIPSSKMLKVRVQNRHARYPSAELAQYMDEHMYKDKK